MVETIFVGLALLLAAGGIIGTILPLVPGPLITFTGVGTYWWASGFSDPSLPVLIGFLAVAVIATSADIAAGAFGASAGGGDRVTAVVAGIMGLILFPVVGPLGVVLGVAGGTFVISYRRSGSYRQGLAAALGATTGLLASVFVQMFLTLVVTGGLIVVILF